MTAPNECFGRLNRATAVTIQLCSSMLYAIITQNASLNAAPSFVQYYKLAFSISAGPRYQQRSDVLRYVEAEEASEPKYSIQETRGEEELGMV